MVFQRTSSEMADERYIWFWSAYTHPRRYTPSPSKANPYWQVLVPAEELFSCVAEACDMRQVMPLALAASWQGQGQGVAMVV